MRLSEIIILSIILLTFWYWIIERPIDPIKTINFITPDSRIIELDTRVKALEIWAQKQGMKY
jgi:hypothetical protein